MVMNFFLRNIKESKIVVTLMANSWVLYVAPIYFAINIPPNNNP